jgi:hypothetical protein
VLFYDFDRREPTSPAFKSFALNSPLLKTGGEFLFVRVDTPLAPFKGGILIFARMKSKEVGGIFCGVLAWSGVWELKG